jgi:hypothetical protein
MARTVLSLFGEAYRVVIDEKGEGLDPSLLSPFIFDLNQTIENGYNSLSMNVDTLQRGEVHLEVIDITWYNPEKEMLLGGKTFDDHIDAFLEKLEFYFEDPTIEEQDSLALP